MGSAISKSLAKGNYRLLLKTSKADEATRLTDDIKKQHPSADVDTIEGDKDACWEADIIIMYFAPHSQSPISLLELGLYAKTDKLMVVCPEGYWRKSAARTR